MAKVILSITLSVDGFIAGPDISAELPMGVNGILLHNWIFQDISDTDRMILSDLTSSSGSVILGSTTYDTAIEQAWEGATPFDAPALVLTHREPKVKAAGFEFLRGSANEALFRARELAAGKNVWVMGGANVAQQFIREKLLDEIHLHIAPILLARGTRLFGTDEMPPLALECFNFINTKAASHVFYKVKR